MDTFVKETDISGEDDVMRSTLSGCWVEKSTTTFISAVDALKDMKDPFLIVEDVKIAWLASQDRTMTDVLIC